MIIKGKRFTEYPSPQHKLSGTPTWWGHVKFLTHIQGVDVYWYQSGTTKGFLMYNKPTSGVNYKFYNMENYPSITTVLSTMFKESYESAEILEILIRKQNEE